MPFVKLDCGILNSSLWIDHDARTIFVTALLMARPFDLADPCDAIAIRKIEPLGFTVPAGSYGFVAAASTGIIAAAGLPAERGRDALERLCATDEDSRTPDNEGRRMVRIDGGFLILNYGKYRNLDRTNAERQARHREKKRASPIAEDQPPGSNGSNGVTSLRSNVSRSRSRSNTGDKSPVTPVSKELRSFSPGPKRPGTSPEKLQEIGELAASVGRIMHRQKPVAEWSPKEQAAFRKLRVAGAFLPDEIALVASRYADEWPPGANENTLRRDLFTLLNNWTGEVDRARHWTEAKTTPPANTHAPKPGAKW